MCELRARTITRDLGVSELDRGVDLPEAVIDAFAAAAERLAYSASLDEALGEIARAAANALGADLVVVRVLDPDGFLRARALTAASQALAAELEGSRYPLAEPGSTPEGVRAALVDAVDRTAARLGAESGLVVPVLVGGRPAGSLELYRARKPISTGEERIAQLAAAQAALAVRAFGSVSGANGSVTPALAYLDLAGDALAAGLEQAGTADQIARLAAEATGAVEATIWDADAAAPLGSYGGSPTDADREAARTALDDPRSVVVEGTVATVPLGRPPFALLQLRFAPAAVPAGAELEQLASFGVRAADALRLSERAGRLAGDLARTQALLGVLGQAIARLSLSHTLEIAVDRVASLLAVERLAVYLRDEEGRLTVAEARGAAGIDAAVAVALLVREELIGLLAVYPSRGRELAADETALLSALAV